MIMTNMAEIYVNFNDAESALVVKAWNFMRNKYPDLPLLALNTLPFADANNVWKTLDEYLEWGNYDFYPRGEQEDGTLISKKIRRQLKKRVRVRLRERERL